MVIIKKVLFFLLGVVVLFFVVSFCYHASKNSLAPIASQVVGFVVLSVFVFGIPIINGYEYSKEYASGHVIAFILFLVVRAVQLNFLKHAIEFFRDFLIKNYNKIVDVDKNLATVFAQNFINQNALSIGEGPFYKECHPQEMSNLPECLSRLPMASNTMTLLSKYIHI